MKNGNLIREKKEYLKERFSTIEGLIDFFLGSAIWGFLIIKYIDIIKLKSDEIWLNLIPLNFFANYLSYLTIGVVFAGLGLLISFIIIFTFKKIKKVIR